MNVKNFIVGGIVGGIADFLMGWLLYGMLLKDFFPKPEGAGAENITFIFLGCMCFGFMMSFIFNQGEGISKCVPGVKLAIGIALFMSLSMNFFYSMYSETINWQMVAVDVLVSIVIASVVGAVIAVVNGKMK
ncbi:hypothetical protein HKT18_04170 [Flavobacterium sp. IMCC34852]|uniref:DUF1761 domain-containing protein n=1 Tax=Flavobacterium rivulicola TaxID=2732161 RepID=A0A7Y3R8N3_9FLAO|nr:hypothetical protein [Flavobacterium sp. IMCC34852]NNT71407.1 hypothetical protein [Flavobacterium sp. IMCC34852]